MAEREELEALRALQAAKASGDARGELAALRTLRAARGDVSAAGRASPPGPSVSGIINRGGSFPGGALEPPVPPLEVGQSIGQRGAARFISNAIGTPSAIGELLSIGAAGAQAGAGELAERAGGRQMPLGERFAQAREEQAQSFPASLLMKSPSPSPEQVAAAGQTAGRLPQIIGGPETFGGVFREKLQQQRAAAEQHPIQTALGDMGGDALSILSMRPMTRRMFPAARSAPVVEKEAVDIIDSAANRLTAATGFAKRLGSQAGEAGFEGAMLAAMGDGDPLATAGWVAGTQVGGSLALQGSKAFLRHPWRTIGGVAMAHWIYKALAPGGQGPIEDVRDETVQTAITTFGLGALATMAGAGRLAPGKTPGRDRFIDAFDSIRRAPVASIIKQLHEADEAGDNRLSKIIGKIAEDPDYFGREVRMQIERASRSEEPNALRNEVDDLMRSDRFRQRFEEL